MPPTLSTIEHAEDEQENTEATAALQQIDNLIRQCQERMAGVSENILSFATKNATLLMYKDLRRDAEKKDLRMERLAWMEENIIRLQETIEKAAQERALFMADLAMAVEKKWIHPSDTVAWLATFEDPNLLEMYRSQWFHTEWTKRFKAGWKQLDDDRMRVLQRAREQGVTVADLPELQILENDALFLAKERKFPARRSLVDSVDAAIDHVRTQNMATFRRTEALLLHASKGRDRFLHPAKVGAWLKKIMGDPGRYPHPVVTQYLHDWKAARSSYDRLAERTAAMGHPDGCAPLPLHAFLEKPYEARLVVLAEWQHRLDAAERQCAGEGDLLEQAKKSIRNAIDLNDLTTAEERLAALVRTHQTDPDVRSITEHLALLRAEQEHDRDTQEESARTSNALAELHTMQQGVPTVLTKYYAHLFAEGDADQAATFFLSMKVRTDRMKSGRTSQHEEYIASLTAEDIEETTVISEPTDVMAEEPDATQLLVTAETPPVLTLALLKAHGGEGKAKAPAMIIEGVPYEQQLQLVALNERALANMRHLHLVGASFASPLPL